MFVRPEINHQCLDNNQFARLGAIWQTAILSPAPSLGWRLAAAEVPARGSMAQKYINLQQKKLRPLCVQTKEIQISFLFILTIYFHLTILCHLLMLFKYFNVPNFQT